MSTQNATEITHNLPVDSNAIQNKVLGMLDAIQNGAVVIGQETVKYAPDVVNVSLDVIRINCVQEAAYRALWCVIWGIATYLTIKLWKFAKKEQDTDIWGCAFAGILTYALMSAIVLKYVMDIWIYIGIFQPKLYIAHELIEKVIK